MSALPPKADISLVFCDVHFVRLGLQLSWQRSGYGTRSVQKPRIIKRWSLKSAKS